MNKTILIFLFFLIGVAVRLSAQVNLVPNPSFELYDTCPSTVVADYFDGYVANWKTQRYSPEYFNSCANGVAGVPYNFGGYQNASTGNAYAGIYTYESSVPNVREIIGVELTSPLSIGKSYTVRFKASLAIDNYNVCNYATNYLGARFSTIDYSLTNPAPINNSAHIFSTSVIVDTLGWVTISGAFVADSAYSYISIGNFFDDSAITISYVQDTAFDIAAYYYIDDVSVVADSLNSPGQNNGGTDISIYPNPIIDLFTIKLPNQMNSDNIVLTIYNVIGEKVSEASVSANAGVILASRKGLRSGVYLLKIMTGDTTYCHQVIIE